MKKHSKQALLALKAMRRATNKVVKDALKNDLKIPVWKNQKVVYENPEIIAEQLNAAEGEKCILLKTNRK
ncbi:hypothetical protein K8T06_02620 [bacterium]|nr:hypothetical protein [bacterium]